MSQVPPTMSQVFSTSQVPPTPEMIRILIADDHQIVRQGLMSILNDQKDMIVIAEANNGREAIEQFRVHQPNITLLDLRMPEVGGVEAINTIRAEFPEAYIIMFTIYDTDEDIYRGLRAGAKAYLLKDTPSREVLDVIRTVHQGHRYIPSSIIDKLAHHLEQPELTERELGVLQQMAQGKSNKAIALTLDIAENTVKFHINNVLSKLGANDRTHAVVIALKRGIVKF